ncbi:hypothetical protein PFICI_04209 [Pestalotiopsis fici W106-1]|uniref:Uncharacterized protein n=1 Tax=Pestalotiopsis fici (strain W106-1 / CGMCC3.15140) TaxID=1229662 RepID=W3X885_PESFW|nr:uncharacterized protein PFICI_04209 [Pestalotiopsis fici W106-1]ETS82333.1 hypothetical protein PFICI_04209 [Pestalotiopsis fici W106-1]
MPSIGEKIKSVFTTEHSAEAEKGVVDHRTPGSFPEEDSAAQDQHQHREHHEHNKLHKRDDPRDYTIPISQENPSAAGYSHKPVDSGVGLGGQPLAHDSVKNISASPATQPYAHDNSRQATDEQNRPDTSAVPGTGLVAAGAGGVPARALGEDRSGQKPLSGIAHDGHASTSRDTPLDRSGLSGTEAGNNPGYTSHQGTTGIGAAAVSGAHDNSLPSQASRRDVADSKDSSAAQKEEPYWGDLPQGSGVYNTVIGHGSGEDTSTQHRAIPRGPDDGQSPRNAASSSSPDQLSYGSGVYNTVTGHGSNDEHDAMHYNEDGHRVFPLNDSHDTSHDRHIGEAGTAMGVGAAAYGASQHHKHAKEADAGTLPSGGNVTGTEARRPLQDTMNVTPTNTRDAGGAALAGRHKDQTQHVTGGRTTAQDSNDYNSKAADPTGHQHKITGFLHRRHDEEGGSTAHKRASDIVTDDSVTSGSTSRPELKQSLEDDSSHRNRNAAGLAGVGAGAAMGYGLSRHEKQHENDTPVQYQPEQASTINNAQTSLSHGTTNQPAGYAENDSQFQQSRQTPSNVVHDDRHASQARNLAGVGAAAGAGYGASKMAQHEKQPIDTRNQTGIASGSIRTPENTSVQSAAYNSSTSTKHDSYDHLASGTASGVARDTHGHGQSNLANTASGQPESSQYTPGNQGGQSPYNVLASGTPSGVQVENKPSTNLHTSSTPSSQPLSKVSEDCPKCGATK